MYKVVQRFNGKEEKKTFEVGTKHDFKAERAEYLSALGFIEKVKDKKDEQHGADL